MSTLTAAAQPGRNWLVTFKTGGDFVLNRSASHSTLSFSRERKTVRRLAWSVCEFAHFGGVWSAKDCPSLALLRQAVILLNK